MSENVLRELRNLRTILFSTMFVLKKDLEHYDKNIEKIKEGVVVIKEYLDKADVEKFLSGLTVDDIRISIDKIDNKMGKITEADLLGTKRYQDLYLFLGDLSKHVPISSDVQDKIRRVAEEMKPIEAIYEDIHTRSVQLKKQLYNILRDYSENVDESLIKQVLET
jgi:predicted  nucleic acid-binding Zn-ribbon protein